MTIYSRNSIQSKTFNIITIFSFLLFDIRSCPILMLPMPIQNVCHVTHNNASARIKNGFKRCKKMERHVCSCKQCTVVIIIWRKLFVPTSFCLFHHWTRWIIYKADDIAQCVHNLHNRMGIEPLSKPDDTNSASQSQNS